MRMQSTYILRLTLIITALNFVFTNCIAQKSEVFGFIYDRETSEPLPYATISIDGTSTGTSSDHSGAYSLKLDTGSVTIRYQFLGYADTVMQFHTASGQRLRHDVYLAPSTINLDELTVSANRTAQKVQQFARLRNAQNARLHSYKAEVYKLSILSSLDGNAPEFDTLAMAFSERNAEIIYLATPERYSETIIAHRASKNFFSEYDFFSTGGGPLNLNQDEIPISILSEDITVVGPVSVMAGQYYDLYESAADSSWPPNTREIYFKPLTSQRPLFQGSVWINEQTSAILGMDVRLNDYASTNTGTFSISDIRYSQSYFLVDGFWLPKSTTLSAELKFIGNKNEILYEDEWTWTNYSINNQEIKAAEIELNTTRILPEAGENTESYWAGISARGHNSNFTQLEEAAAFKEKRSTVLFGMFALRTLFKLPVWLQHSNLTNISDFYRFNRVQSHYFGAGFRSRVHPNYEYRISGGYGTGNKAFSYKLSGYHFIGNSFWAPEFSYKKEVMPQYQDYEYNRTPIDFYEARQTFNSLVYNYTGINYFERKGIEAGLRLRLRPDSFLRLLYVDEKHSALRATTFSTLFGSIPEFEHRLNNDMIYPAVNARLRGLHVHLHHDTRQYLQTQFLRDYNIRNFGWLTDVQIEKGISRWGSDVDFTRYRAALKFYWPVFSSHFFQTDIIVGAADSGTPGQRMFTYNGFVVDDYVRYRPFNTINYAQPLGYRVSELRIRYKFGSSLTRKLPIEFLAKSGIKISTFATVGIIDEKSSLEPLLLPHSASHTQAEIGVAVTRIFGFIYTEFSKKLYGRYGSSVGFTARF